MGAWGGGGGELRGPGVGPQGLWAGPLSPLAPPPYHIPSTLTTQHTSTREPSWRRDTPNNFKHQSPSAWSSAEDTVPEELHQTVVA
jgi:hypothetical protein